MRKLSNVLLAVIFVLLCPLLWAGSSQANIPGWVKDLAAQPLGTYPPRTDAVVLLDETTLSVTGPSEYVETSRRVVRILRPEGHSEGYFGVPYEKDDKVLNCHAWSIDSAGRQYEVKEKEFEDRGSFSDWELYSDNRMRIAKVPAAEVGSVVAFESSVRRRLWIAQPTWYFQEDIPVKEARYAIELPSGWEYKAFWVNAEPVEPTKAGNRVQWIRRDVPAIAKEKGRPSLRALSGRLELAYFAPGGTTPAADCWKSIGAWYNGLLADRRNPSPEIQAETKRLTAGAAGFDAIVRALALFVQTDIRYVAVEIGIGGWQPHPATDVFKHRYGDCKDKANLLSSMLQVVGIRSYHVVIHTEHGIVKADAPALTFNHAIIAIEVPKDAPKYRSVITAQDGRKMLIFDPTDTYTPLGELRGDLQGNVALLVTEAGGEAITLPLLDPASNTLAREGKFRLSSDGMLYGELVEKRTGDHANSMRYLMKQSSESERIKNLERVFGSFLNGATIRENNVENLAQISQELVLRVTLSSGKYTQNAGPLVLVRPRVIGEKGISIEWKDRKYPVVLEAPSLETDSYEIAVPKGFVIDDLPEPAQIDVGFASYKSHFEVADGAIRYHREYIVKEPLVPLEKLGDLKRLEQTIGRDENATVVFKVQD